MRPVRATLIGVTAFASVACGPSFHAVYEGEARFEHCYALDDTPRASPQERVSCWQAWLARYAGRDTRDRAQYAVVRRDTLLRQIENPVTQPAKGVAPEPAPGDTARRGLQ
ncbi:MAG: hypothetical protein U0174_07860 [Polyangiaceae bacterium]